MAEASRSCERSPRRAGFSLVERLAIYPSFCDSPSGAGSWIDPTCARRFSTQSTRGLSAHRRVVLGGRRRATCGRRASRSSRGSRAPSVSRVASCPTAADARRSTGRLWNAAGRGTRSRLLFTAHGAEAERLYATADELRRETVGDEVTYVVNRNINYTNMCYFKCGFCAFSQGPKSLNLRGEPYLLTPEEVADRAREAWEHGATEVCMQGGIHHSFTGDNYLEYLEAVKDELPEMHVHAFTALEVAQGARASGLSIRGFPDSAARGRSQDPSRHRGGDTRRRHPGHHLSGQDHYRGMVRGAPDRTCSRAPQQRDDHVRHRRRAAELGPRHLAVVRALHDEIAASDTAACSSSCRLPFVHMAAPIYLEGKSTARADLRRDAKDACGRAYRPARIDRNIQVSWVKMGVEGAKLALQAGANDLGGTLMNENISRAAGASHGQELDSRRAWRR